jgi:hypothetical protein
MTALGEDQYAKRKQGWACSALSCGRPSRRLSDRAPNGIAAGPACRAFIPELRPSGLHCVCTNLDWKRMAII